MVYMDRVCTDFGGQQKRKMCRSGKDIGRACNMSHAEQVAGEKVWSVHGLNFPLARAGNARV